MIKNKILQYSIAALAGIVISLYFRFLPYSGMDAHNMKTMASAMVLQKIQKTVEDKVDASFPGISAQERSAYVRKGVADIINNNRDDINEGIRKITEKLQESDKQNRRDFYLLEADSYYYLGLIKNLIETGKVSPVIKNGLYFNRLMMAPLGNYYYFDLHPYVGLFVYKAVSALRRGITLEKALAYTSPVITIAILLLFMFLAYMEGFGIIPVFIALVFFSGAPMFFQRSLFGWFDTDPYNILFPLLIITACFRSVTSSKDSLWIIAAGILTGLYTAFWVGWTYVPICMLVLFILTLLFGIFEKDRALVRKAVKHYSIYFISALAAILVVRGPGGLMFSITDTYSRLFTFTGQGFSLWPDAFITVGELKKIPLVKIAVLSGGRILNIIGLFGIFWIFRSWWKDRTEKEAARKGLVLLSFLAVPFIMSLNAERFTILLVVPACVCFLFGINVIYTRLMAAPSANIRIILTAALLSGVLIPSASMYIMAVRKQPIIFNPTWAGAMEYIKENTPENSVIDCWWPPGHFITGMGRRGVLFDGATLEKHVGYWVSRFFLSSDEKKALGILRMIDLAGNSATEYLVSKGIPLSEAVSILNTITAIDRGSAASYLESRLKLPEVNELLSMTHGQPPPSYVMVYRDLAEKSIAFQFLGNWDFKKAEEFKAIKENTPDLAAQIIKDKADNNMIKFYWMISGGPMYQENESPQAHRAGNVVQFANGIALDLDTMSISPMTGDTRVADKISSVVYAEGNSIKERYQASGGGLALLLVRRGEAYSAVIVDRRLKDCMLFRMYYFNGAGLEHFKEVFSLNADSDNTDIKLFRVDW